MANNISYIQLSPIDALSTGAIGHLANSDESNTEDVRLALAAVNDREAYAELYRRHATGVFRYMLAHTGNAQDAQDLTAQTFLAGLEGITTYRAHSTFTAWLFGIAYHKVMDYYRRDHLTLPFDQLDATPCPAKQPDQVVEDRFAMQDLAAAIRKLSPDRAEALTLRVFAELSVNEIGELMGRRQSAVRMLLSRAIHDLKQLMAPDIMGSSEQE